MSKFKSIQRRFFKYFPNYRISISYRKTSEGVAFRNKYMSSRLYSIVAGAMLNPEPVPVYELMPGFQIGVYGSCFLFIFLVIAGLYRKILPLVLLGYAMVYVIGVLIPLLGYVVSMMNYFASVG